MKVRRTLSEADEPIELNLIPLIDVIMFLLIFFISDLDVAVGAGGSLAGFGGSMTFATADAIQDAAFELADLERQPEPLSQTAPAYPPELRKARIEGSVTLIFVLSEDGRVEDPRIESSSRPEFEKPALDAVRKWRFKPGLKDGNPVRTYLRLPMRFKIHS